MYTTGVGVAPFNARAVNVDVTVMLPEGGLITCGGTGSEIQCKNLGYCDARHTSQQG